MSQNHAAVTSDHGNAPSVAGPRRTLRERLVAARSAVSAAFGSVLAVVPHVLHHIGILAGAAFLTGLGGSLLLGALGLVFSIPLLRRLYRRFGTWKAPTTALVVFAAMFSLSAFVIGPAISGGGSSNSPAPAETPAGHNGHHAG
jgi:hypothetical protein